MEKTHGGEYRRPAQRPVDELPEKHLGGVLGMWFNKRQLVSVEIPFRHHVVPEHGGWRLEALEAGRLNLKTVDGRVKVDVEKGDELVSAGDDFYLSLSRAPEQTDESADKED